jgi:hypothetical protein
MRRAAEQPLGSAKSRARALRAPACSRRARPVVDLRQHRDLEAQPCPPPAGDATSPARSRHSGNRDHHHPARAVLLAKARGECLRRERGEARVEALDVGDADGVLGDRRQPLGSEVSRAGAVCGEKNSRGSGSK